MYYHVALRCERVFPQLTWVPLAGTREEPDYTSHARTTYAAAPVSDNDPAASALLTFLDGPEVARIYTDHGLSAPA